LGRGKPGFGSRVCAIQRRARGGHLGLKTENGAAGARISRTMCGGLRIQIVRGRLGPGKPGFGSWVPTIQRRAKGGSLGSKIESQAAGAQLSRTTCAGARIWIVGGRLWWGKPGFGSWVRAIKRCARRGLDAAKSRNRATRARFWPMKHGGALNQVEETRVGFCKCK
jgi:hypothetical protein